MSISRRDLFRIAGAAAPALACAQASTGLAQGASSEGSMPATAVGLLFDASKCIGCKACVSACSEANGLSPDVSIDGLHQEPLELNASTKNIIKLCKPTQAYPESFVKQQCMHCADAACVAACPFHALQKNPISGIVEWHEEKCIGCRYCEIACPFHIPKFEWAKFNPKIVKCQLCDHRLGTGQEPACTYVCPTHAVIFGKRETLLETAKERIAETPGKYFENRVYGEHEAGGTQVLYLSVVPFAALGLPTLGTQSVPSRLGWQKVGYKFMAAPLLLYGVISGLMKRNWVQHEQEMDSEAKKSGLKPQL